MVMAVLAVRAFVQAQTAAHAVAFQEAASDARKFQMPAGLRLDIWAAEPQLSNSVAFSFDGRGRAFLAQSDRWAISVFDITAHTNWLLEDMSFRTVADRAAFLRREFATNLTFLTRESEVIRMVEDRDGDGRADAHANVATGFNSETDGTAAGILASGDRLYFGNIPNLWRFTAPPVRGAVAVQTPTPTNLLAHGFGVHIGVSGHDLHGLIRGPDGRIYLSFGDRGVCLTNREGAVINLPDCGGVLRCEPDGRNLELFCFGLRNPQELAFDDLGNLWTVDNDTAGADPCRVLHLVEGGDYGWRTSYQHQEGFGPWVKEELWKGGKQGILPLAGTVSQGPSGLAYYPGTGWGDRMRGRFVHCDFPGGVWEFTVKPRGASFEVDSREKLVWNCWPTDVEFGPDGGLYVLDWVSGWGQTPRGRIYRLTPEGGFTGAAEKEVAEVRQGLGEGFADRTESQLLQALGHADRRIRLESQWALADRGVSVLEPLLGLARESRSRLQRLHALWGAGQILRNIPVDRSSDSVDAAVLGLLQLVNDADRWVAATAAQALAAAGAFEGLEGLTPLLSDPDPGVRRVAGEALAAMPLGRRFREVSAAAWERAGRSEVPWVREVALRFGGRADTNRWIGPVPSVRRLIEGQEGDLYLQHVARMILQRGATWGPSFAQDLELASTDASPDLRWVALLARRRLAEWVQITPVIEGRPDFAREAGKLAARLTNALTDLDPRLIEEAGYAIHEVPVVEGLPALASFVTKIDCPPALHSRVIDACFRLGTQQHAQMMASFAVREDVPDDARVLAVQALAEWGQPPALDRVNGLWRPLVTLERGAGTERDDAGGPAGRSTAAPANPLLERAAQAARNFGRAAELPVLPSDLGRSTAFAEGRQVTRNPVPARRAFLRVAGDLMNPFNLTESGVPAGTREVLAVQIATAEAAARLQVKEASSPLFERFARTNTPPALRRAILPALNALHAPQLSEAVQLALADPDPSLRAAALPFLGRLEGGDAVQVLVKLVPGVPDEWRLAQSALAQLGERAAGDPAAAEALNRWAALQRDGQFPARLSLDLREARRRIPGASSAAEAPGDLHRECLEGGDARRGKEVFFQQPAVQCLRCHRVGNEGGTVGPNLSDVGRRVTRAELLESIVNPNARIAAGFETVVITLKNGETVVGVVREDRADTVVVDVTDGETGQTQSVRVPVADIQERQRGVSAMPEGLGALLTPFELRDLVEYLAGLK